MGTIYITNPIDEKTGTWLCQLGIAVPEGTSRLPSASELFEAVSEKCVEELALEGSEGSWRVSGGPEDWTTINWRKAGGESVEFSFSKGSEDYVLEICRAIAKRSGPFVVVPDYSGVPVVVSSS